MTLTKADKKYISETMGEALIKNNKVLFEVIVQDIDQKIKEVKEQIKYLPTKDEFYTSQDELVKELKDLREETTVHNHQVSKNSDRIEKLEAAAF